MKWKASVRWVALMAGISLAGLFAAPPAWGLGDASKLVIPQVLYQGGQYKPRPRALESLLAQVGKRTSVEVKRDPLDLELTDPRLFRHPFLYMGGDLPFSPFATPAVKRLRDYLNFGGFLLVDDNSSQPNSGFDASVRRLIQALFPHTPLEKIRSDHSIFRSFYLVNQVAGRTPIRPYIEGITLKGRTVLVYCGNDLGGAWSKNKLGHWSLDMVGGGPRQRTLSVRLGVNLVLYSLTLDYKKDLVHLPIILERLRRYDSR